MSIRSIHNADLPSLVNVWREHWSTFGPPPEVNSARFEQAILARTFFDPATLLVAESGARIQAWSHFQMVPHTSTAVICALCRSSSCPHDLATQLFRETIARIEATEYQNVEVGVAQDDWLGYGGLDPIGHGIGIPQTDAWLGSLVESHGFRPCRTFLRLQASVAGYRAPVSREGLQFRRSSKLQTQKLLYPDPRHAASMSHLDVESHQLLDRGNHPLAEVKLWFSDAEAEVMGPAKVIIDLEADSVEEQLCPAKTYLVGAVILAACQRRIRTIETAVPQDATTMLSQLQALQFQVVEEGIVWQKP